MTRTRNFTILVWVFTTLSILLNVCPLAVYAIQALVAADLVVEKITLTMTVLVVLIMSIVAWANKTTMRSRIWVILLGIYLCLDKIMVPLIIIAITQVVDEWIVAPLAASYRTKLTINKELDRRGV